MIITHPFEPYIPKGADKIFMGSFPPENIDWYYGSKVNQFWKIISKIYNIQLYTIKDKKNFLKEKRFGIMDIIYKCIRKRNDSSDSNLEIVKLFNLDKYMKNIKVIYFTSRFVEKIYLKNFNFPIKTITLPSPSPRYARMTIEEKSLIYSQYLVND